MVPARQPARQLAFHQIVVLRRGAAAVRMQGNAPFEPLPAAGLNSGVQQQRKHHEAVRDTHGLERCGRRRCEEPHERTGLGWLTWMRVARHQHRQSHGNRAMGRGRHDELERFHKDSRNRKRRVLRLPKRLLARRAVFHADNVDGCPSENQSPPTKGVGRARCKGRLPGAL